MADDRGIALCFDMRAEVAKVRWVLEAGDRHGELDCWGRQREVDTVGRCWDEDSCPVLGYDLTVAFDWALHCACSGVVGKKVPPSILDAG